MSIGEEWAKSGDGLTKRTVLRVLAVVVLAMLVADVLVIMTVTWAERIQPRSFRGGYWGWQDMVMILAYSMFGIVASQLLLAVAYAALGDGPSPRRVLYTTFTLAIFTNVLVLFSMWWFEIYWGSAVGIFLAPMFFFFVLQIPLWGIRSSFGWTIVSPWSDSRVRQPMRFTLAHILGWSAFLAVPLCILQVFMQGARGSMGSGAVILCCWAAILCVLLMWFLYVALAANLGIWKSIAASTLVLLGAVAVQIIVMSFLEGRPDFEAAMILGITNFSAGAVLFACLSLAHRLGFRLLPFEAKRPEQLP